MREGWKRIKLGEFMEFKNGINADKEAYGSGMKFVNVMDIFKKTFLDKEDIGGSVKISDKQAKDYSVVKGDILFNRTSETVEEIAYSSVYVGEEPVTFGGFVIRGRQTLNLLLPDFAGYCFKNDQIRKELISSCQGVIRSNIGQKDLNEISIFIPPLHEQRKIAEILRTWDQGIEKVEKQEALFELQKRGLMQRLLAGNSYTKTIPDGWKAFALKDLGKVVTGITPPTDNAGYYYGLYPFVSPADINGAVYLHGTGKSLSEEGIKKANLIPKDSILFTCIGSTIGKLCISHMALATNQQINSIIPDNQRVDTRFLYYALSQIAQSIKRIAGTQAVPIVNKSLFEQTVLVLPTLSEQQRIGRILKTLDDTIANLQGQKELFQSQKRGLMQMLLDGKLSARK